MGENVINSKKSKDNCFIDRGIQALTHDHPGAEHELMGDGGARPQQPQATVGLPAKVKKTYIYFRKTDSLNEAMTARRCSVPAEHAVDDGEEEDKVNNAFPV